MNDMLTNMMGAVGRGGDSMIGHLTPGDVVIPRDVILANPEFLTKFKKAMEELGGDYRSHVAGSGYENYNPDTGAPEFFFKGLRNFFSNPGKQIAQYVLANPFTGQDLFGLNPQPAAAAPTPPPAPALPPPDLGPVQQETTPTRPAEATKPFDLFSRDAGGQSFSTLDPMQQRSYLATQGTFGSGLGDEDKNYYLNLLQRNLIDENGQLSNINNALLPVERNYLSRIGLPTDDTAQFFKALQ